MNSPDYATLRQKAGFSWRVAATQEALVGVTRTPMREFNLNPRACIEAFRKGRPLLREMYGDEIQMPTVSTPAISYGHINGVGAELYFPDLGQVGHNYPFASLTQGIETLKKPVDFAKAGRLPFYLDFHQRMQAAFPNEPVRFAMGFEGPITTAWALRGEGFFTDIFDDPPAVQAYLRLVTRSILDYHRFICSLRGWKALNPDGAFLCDDVASMVPPHRWKEFVLPFWDQYFLGMTTGARHAHVEDLKAIQLKHLEEIGLAFYDPSVSRKLNPGIIFRECRVPFEWLLCNFQCRYLSVPDVKDFVFMAAADGASHLECHIAEDMLDEASIPKVRTFIESAQAVKRMLDEGGTRPDLGKRISASGQKKFWNHWLD